MGSETRTTTDHDEVRRWVEENARRAARTARSSNWFSAESLAGQDAVSHASSKRSRGGSSVTTPRSSTSTSSSGAFAA